MYVSRGPCMGKKYNSLRNCVTIDEICRLWWDIRCPVWDFLVETIKLTRVNIRTTSILCAFLRNTSHMDWMNLHVKWKKKSLKKKEKKRSKHWKKNLVLDLNSQSYFFLFSVQRGVKIFHYCDGFFIWDYSPMYALQKSIVLCMHYKTT